MMPFITRRRHDAEMAKVRAEQRTTGAALNEALDERDQWKKQALAAEEDAFNAKMDVGYLNARNVELQDQLNASYVRVGSRFVRYDTTVVSVPTPPETTA